jgi:ferric-dicitrate binding protein FerR (iron transport regulator)
MLLKCGKTVYIRLYKKKKADMKKDEQKEQLIEVFLTGKPAFDPVEIDVLNAERRVFKQIETAQPFRRFMMYFQRVAAILVIPLIILSVYPHLGEPEAGVPGSEVYQELTVPYGMVSQINLPDGSKVWLNGGSSLKYPLKFGKGRRNVLLNGEGYFDVQSDKKNPFIVQTEQLRLTATGTRFNIEAYRTDSVTCVTMVDGKIDVAFNQVAPFAMKAGKRVSYNDRTGRSEMTETDTYRWCAWKDGLMIFRDDPLAYVFKRLARTFNVDIHVKNPEIAPDAYRATFEDESLDEILLLLEKTAPIRFVQHKREMSSNDRYRRKQIDVYKQGK